MSSDGTAPICGRVFVITGGTSNTSLILISTGTRACNYARADTRMFVIKYE